MAHSSPKTDNWLAAYHATLLSYHVNPTHPHRLRIAAWKRTRHETPDTPLGYTAVHHWQVCIPFPVPGCQGNVTDRPLDPIEFTPMIESVSDSDTEIATPVQPSQAVSPEPLQEVSPESTLPAASPSSPAPNPAGSRARIRALRRAAARAELNANAAAAVTGYEAACDRYRAGQFLVPHDPAAYFSALDRGEIYEDPSQQPAARNVRVCGCGRHWIPWWYDGLVMRWDGALEWWQDAERRRSGEGGGEDGDQQEVGEWEDGKEDEVEREEERGPQREWYEEEEEADWAYRERRVAYLRERENETGSDDENDEDYRSGCNVRLNMARENAESNSEDGEYDSDGEDQDPNRIGEDDYTEYLRCMHWHRALFLGNILEWYIMWLIGEQMPGWSLAFGLYSSEFTGYEHTQFIPYSRNMDF